MPDCRMLTANTNCKGILPNSQGLFDRGAKLPKVTSGFGFIETFRCESIETLRTESTDLSRAQCWSPPPLLRTAAFSVCIYTPWCRPPTSSETSRKGTSRTQ